MNDRPAALITGASKRIGREIAITLAKQGYDIALHCNRSIETAELLKNEITAYGVICHIFPYDLSEVEGIESWFHKIHEMMPNLNVLINNASVFDRKRLHESDLTLFQKHMVINATAPILLTKAFASQVTHGHVINMLDVDIVTYHGSHFAYLLSKKHLAAFTLMAARELAPHIQVNGICPGHILPNSQDPVDYEKKLLDRLPIQEFSTPQDITASILWLLSQPRVTGQFIFNDSGQHLL